MFGCGVGRPEGAKNLRERQDEKKKKKKKEKKVVSFLVLTTRATTLTLSREEGDPPTSPQKNQIVFTNPSLETCHLHSLIVGTLFSVIGVLFLCSAVVFLSGVRVDISRMCTTDPISQGKSGTIPTLYSLM
jgi:hypothetical protein